MRVKLDGRDTRGRGLWWELVYRVHRSLRHWMEAAL